MFSLLVSFRKIRSVTRKSLLYSINEQSNFIIGVIENDNWRCLFDIKISNNGISNKYILILN